MRLLSVLSQSVLWAVALIALVLVSDLTTGGWAPLTVLVLAAGASLTVSRTFRASGTSVRMPVSFSRPDRAEPCDYASHSAMSPGMGGIQR
jgi:hypothetical protein